MSSDSTVPTTLPRQPLSLPRSLFTVEDGKGSPNDLGHDASSSGSPPGTSAPSFQDTSPSGVNTPQNPFSPPASILSFRAAVGNADHSPLPTSALSDHQVRYEIPSVSSQSSIEVHPISSVYGITPNSGAITTRPSLRFRESFAPPPTRPITAFSSALAPVKSSQRARSTMLSDTDKLEKPWLDTKAKDPWARVAYFVTYGMILVGIATAFIRIYTGYKGVPMIKGNLCMVLDEEFDGDTNSLFGSGGKWFREIELGGFGNGEFEMTTSSPNNSYVQNGNLYIVPTLTSDVIGSSAIFNGTSYNLTDCTYNQTQNVYPVSYNGAGASDSNLFNPTEYYKSCGAVSNSTIGTIINPIQSARISTRNSASIQYGKVEVRAKLPTGDWLWPAIWMLPVNNTYGEWPMSGEIDIMEARGNSPEYSAQGQNVVRGSLNWGPISFINAVAQTYGWWSERRTTYADGFHTYSLEWTPEFLRLYVDTRLHHLITLSFQQSFFQRGKFPSVVSNGTGSIALQNPWINGTNAAPFDQPFYLILDLAVGGVNGWFPDNIGNKPWLDNSLTAMRDFALGQDQWYPTWPTNNEDRALVVDYVKMWQLC